MDFLKQMSSSKCSITCTTTGSVYARFAFSPSLSFTLSLQSAFYTQSSFYPWSDVYSPECAVRSPQSEVRSLAITLTE